MTVLTIPQLEQVYDALAQAIDQAGPQHTELFLTKLSLLLANEIADDARVQTLIESALRDL
jgi:phosphoribosylaminoimidazole carboxylase (NCAIR synthetase)